MALQMIFAAASFGGHLVSVIAVVLVLGISTLLVYSRHKHQYWERQGVPFVKPTPIFGNMLHKILRRTPIRDVNISEYRALSPHRFGGYYQFTKPALLIRDPELIKCITVKDFDHFVDRPGPNPEKSSDPIFPRMLLNVRGKEWKDLRSVMTPTFTTGKMKRMYVLFEDCCQQLVTHVQGKVGEAINAKDLFSRITMDMISTSAFGFRTNCVSEQDNEILTKALRFMHLSPWWLLRFVIHGLFPGLMNFLRIPVLHKESGEYLTKVVKSVIEQRRREKTRRNDFLQLLMDAGDGTLEEYADNERGASVTGERHLGNSDDATAKPAQERIKMTDEVVIANAVMFLSGGFQSTSYIMMMGALLLALHQDVQDKLYENIQEVLGDDKSQQLTYDLLQKVVYADKVIRETLRIYPYASKVNRCCTKEYTIPGSKTVIREGEVVAIPVAGLHYDEKYYPDPELFDPERFSSERRANISPYVYQPFGTGPRNCIGDRFALLLTKLALVVLVRNFVLKLSPKMKAPFVHDPATMAFTPKGGVWLEFYRRP